MAQDLTESQAPTKPSLPPQLRSLVTAEIVDSFGPYGWEPKEKPWRKPAVITAEQAEAAKAALPAYDAFLAAPSVEWISGRIATLMVHYFVADMPVALAGAVLHDWVDILGDLPQHAIAEACRKWLRLEPRKRPTPGDIRALAMDKVGDEIKTRDRLRVLATGANSGSVSAILNFPSSR